MAEPSVRLAPVYARGWRVDSGEPPQLFDIYVNGIWIGSRRTAAQANEAAKSWQVESLKRFAIRADISATSL